MIEMKKKNEIHGVVFAIVRGGKICLEKRTNPDKSFYGYTIVPGGRIKSGETQEEALLREVQEEYGVEANLYRKVGIVDSVEEGGLINFRHVFLVTSWKGRLSNPERRNKHLRIPLEKARTVCTHPISQRILDQVNKALS